jgi:hypothetical protein
MGALRKRRVTRAMRRLPSASSVSRFRAATHAQSSRESTVIYQNNGEDRAPALLSSRNVSRPHGNAFPAGRCFINR